MGKKKKIRKQKFRAKKQNKRFTMMWSHIWSCLRVLPTRSFLKHIKSCCSRLTTARYKNYFLKFKTLFGKFLFFCNQQASDIATILSTHRRSTPMTNTFTTDTCTPEPSRDKYMHVKDNKQTNKNYLHNLYEQRQRKDKKTNNNNIASNSNSSKNSPMH